MFAPFLEKKTSLYFELFHLFSNAMSCIHFKFKSSLEYEKLTFDGLHISLSDLKEAIMKQKKIGSFNQYTLSVVDAQSKKGE